MRRTVQKQNARRNTMSTRTQWVLALCLLQAGCVTAHSANREVSNSQRIGTLEGLAGTVFQYDEGLYRGGDITSHKGMDELKKLGVKTVFSVTPTDQERELAVQSGIRLVEVPFTKAGVPQDKLPLYLEELRKAEQPLYVHCHSGKNCGGALLAAYRVHQQGWDFDIAKAEFVSLGGNDSEFPTLMESVRKK
jgi:protein tyrosine phosphatase (PTP) superfamily phosphohydrolase (DUF442 family)